MPYRSKSQQRKFQQLLAEGKIKPETVAEFERSSRGLKLPEKLNKKAPKIKVIGGKK